MSDAEMLGGAEVWLGMTETGRGRWNGRKHLRDVPLQARLIPLDLPNLVASGFDNLNGEIALCECRIARDDFALQIQCFQ